MQRLLTLLFAVLVLCLSVSTIQAQSGPEDYYKRAMARFKQGDTDGAIEDFTKFIAVNPQSADAFYSRARALETKGDTDAALADFARAIEVDPQYAEAYASRGLILLAHNQDADAQKDFDKYLQLNPAAKDSLDQRVKYARYQRTKKPKI
jgi:tetratricopeptide (TPR) repeat protein